eukprot:1816140-Rhodomonas_salina.1
MLNLPETARNFRWHDGLRDREDRAQEGEYRTHASRAEEDGIGRDKHLQKKVGSEVRGWQPESAPTRSVSTAHRRARASAESKRVPGSLTAPWTHWKQHGLRKHRTAQSECVEQ